MAFEVPGSAEKAFEKVSSAGFVLALRDGRLRASPHVYNTVAEVDALLDELGGLKKSSLIR